MDRLTRPFQKAYAVTPNDVTPLAHQCRQVIIGGAGTLSYVDWEDRIWTTAILPAGPHAIMAKIIRATGTTATEITACAD